MQEMTGFRLNNRLSLGSSGWKFFNIERNFLVKEMRNFSFSYIDTYIGHFVPQPKKIGKAGAFSQVLESPKSQMDCKIIQQDFNFFTDKEGDTVE